MSELTAWQKLELGILGRFFHRLGVMSAPKEPEPRDCSVTLWDTDPGPERVRKMLHYAGMVNPGRIPGFLEQAGKIADDYRNLDRKASLRAITHPPVPSS